MTSYSVFTVDTLRYVVNLTFDPVTVTPELWPWTFVVYRLWSDETLYEIWMKSSNPRRSYCDFIVWPYDRERVYKLCCGIIFTKRKLNYIATKHQMVNLSVRKMKRYLMVRRYVTLRIWPLTIWPWTVVVHHVSRDQNLYEISAK